MPQFWEKLHCRCFFIEYFSLVFLFQELCALSVPGVFAFSRMDLDLNFFLVKLRTPITLVVSCSLLLSAVFLLL